MLAYYYPTPVEAAVKNEPDIQPVQLYDIPAGTVYDWINGVPVMTDDVNYEWVNGQPYIIFSASTTAGFNIDKVNSVSTSDISSIISTLIANIKSIMGIDVY